MPFQPFFIHKEICKMALLQRGKTKDVYSHGDYTLELKFTDRVTKNDKGEVDPGGNNVSDSLLDGQGCACLSMTSTIFKYLADNGVPTHMVSSDLDNMSMIVRKAVTFKPGLEWVCRWRGTGSFIRRYKTVPGAKDGMVFDTPVFEITIKDDEGGDPLIVHDSIVALGMMDADTLKELVALNAKAMGLIHDLFKQKGLDLWDIKIEWGKDAETGKLMLIDEVSANGCRAYDMSGKNKVAGSALSDCFRA